MTIQRTSHEKTFEYFENFSAKNYHPLPVVLTEGDGVWVKDVEGNEYIDMLASYSAVSQGHCHPKILETLKKQSELLTLTSRAFHNDVLYPFLKKLCELTDHDLALPMNSGAEAVETAIKGARRWGHDRKDLGEQEGEIIVCEGNFHGRTTTIISFSSEASYKEGFGPHTPGFKIIEYGDVEALKKAITDETIGFLVEPIQGESGINVPPEGYLKEVEQVCQEENILLMLDEIQTGLGRTGELFAADHEDVHPDLMILGKALSGGAYPVSAVTGDEEVMGQFNPGSHGSTFGGNPLGAAVASTALEVLQEENLIENSREVGNYFLNELRKLEGPNIEEIRGKGLFIGVDMSKEAGGARPYCEELIDRGILAKDTHQTVVRFAPPLVITKEEIDWAMERIAPVLQE